MKKYLFLLPLLVLFSSVSAQNKLLTIEDALVKNRSVLAPENLRQLQFVYGTEDYVYLKKIDNKDVWVKGNFRSSLEQTFLSLDDLNQKLRAAGYDNLAAMPAIQFNKPTGWIFSVHGNRVALETVSNKIKLLIYKSIINKNIF
jgi:dipeptidyl-peptidase-4